VDNIIVTRDELSAYLAGLFNWGKFVNLGFLSFTFLNGTLVDLYLEYSIIQFSVNYGVGVLYTIFVVGSFAMHYIG